MLPRDELRKLFELRKCSSDTHDSVECARCPKKVVDPSADAADGAAEAPSGASLPVLPSHACLFTLPFLPAPAVPLTWTAMQTAAPLPNHLPSGPAGSKHRAGWQP